MIAPYYSGASVQLFHGDCREILPLLNVQPCAAVCDPPYGETSAAWDRWPDGWVDAVGAVLPATASLWCFGSAGMLLNHPERIAEFRAAGFKYGQEALWVKARGTGPTTRDRLARIHEWAFHWYRGKWGNLHHEWEREVYHGPDKSGNRGDTGSHRGKYRMNSAYADDGTRQPRSVTYLIEAPSVRYQKRHQDEKPLAAVVPLVRECTPPGGLVLDCFAGSGTTGVATKMTGRRALLIEADERSCEIAAERLAENCLDFGAAS